jgi:hypothetical protein
MEHRFKYQYYHIPLLVNIPLPSPMLMVVQKTKKYTAIVSEIASITGTIVTDFSGEKFNSHYIYWN